MADQRPILPWGDYVTHVEHVQLGEYGGECRLNVGLSCSPCREQGRSHVITHFYQHLPDTMLEVLAKINEHEREVHGRDWKDIG